MATRKRSVGMKIQRKRFSIDGKTVLVSDIQRSGPADSREGGAKTPILFLPGLTAAHDDELYQPFYRRITENGGRVFSFDQRGHGDNPFAFDAEKMSDDALSVLQQIKKEGIEKIIVGGHSLGAVVIAQALLKAKGRSDVPEIELMVSFAPPNDMKNNLLVRTAQYALRYKPRQPRLQKAWRQVIRRGYPLLDPANNLRQRLGKALELNSRDSELNAHSLRINDPDELARELGKFPAFTEVVRQLSEKGQLPKTRVILGSRDWIAGPINPLERRKIRRTLEESGIKVETMPIGHIPQGKDLEKLVQKMLAHVNHQES